jgi:ribosomal protein S12 methylthiotransferase
MEQRRKSLMEAQQPKYLKKNQREVGKRVDVLIEQQHPTTGELIGRSARFAPEVDGLVYVQGDAPLGTIVKVEIATADTYDLHGSVVPSPLSVVC